jgi:peptidoglycan hydrolase-like amidase
MLTLRLGTGDRSYRGALRYVNRDTVNVLSLENYVRGVIASEMPASWPAAALQAQAVAARTYAARERADNLNNYFQICDTTACQVYGGVASEQAASNAAAAATAGQVLAYGGQYAFAQFSSSSGGLTSAGSEPYLPAQQDPYDTAAVDPTYRDWTPTAVSIVPLTVAYQVVHPNAHLTSVQITEREDPVAPDKGRVVTVALMVTASDMPGRTGEFITTGIGLASLLFLAWRRKRAMVADPDSEQPGERMEDLEYRVAELENAQQRVLALEERLDFAERLLARQRAQESLPEGR